MIFRYRDMRFIIRHENCGQKALNAYILLYCYSKYSENSNQVPVKVSKSHNVKSRSATKAGATTKAFWCH